MEVSLTVDFMRYLETRISKFGFLIETCGERTMGEEQYGEELSE